MSGPPRLTRSGPHLTNLIIAGNTVTLLIRIKTKLFPADHINKLGPPAGARWQTQPALRRQRGKPAGVRVGKDQPIQPRISVKDHREKPVVSRRVGGHWFDSTLALIHNPASQPGSRGNPMLFLIIGLIVFLGLHSTRIFAEPARTRVVGRLGEGSYKGIYSVVAVIGFALIWYGYGQARLAPSMVWNPPVATRHIATLLTLFSFILLAAAYVPRNRIRRAVGHPMVIAVKIWAFAHLLANGMLADIVLFGSFLIWAVLDFRAARKRDKAAGYVRPPEVSAVSDIATVVIGSLAWFVFAIWLHVWLIGVKPFG